MGVSIIVATYNCKEYISDCLESLLNQSYKDFEVIVCDDCSTDGTLNVLESYSSKGFIKLLKNEHNCGSAYSRNRCIYESRFEYVAIQDADDASTSDRLEKQLAFLENNKDFAFVSSAAYTFEKDITDLGRVMSFSRKTPTKWSFLKGSPFIHPTTVFRKACLLAVNGYRVSKETRRAQDYDLFMRLYSAGYRGKEMDDVLYYYRLDLQTKKRMVLSSCRDEMRIRLKGYKSLHLMPIGYLFCLKPFFAFLLHKMGFYRYKAKKR